jgi:hypothetical protein
VLTREYPCEPVGLECEDRAGEVRGILPLLPTRGLPLAGVRAGRRLSSLPRTPVAGPLSLDNEATAALLQAAADWAHVRPGTRLEIKPALPLPEAVTDGLLLPAPWRLSYSVELPSDPAALRFGDPRNHARIRWARNKAEKLGVRVRPAESRDDLRRWYAIYLYTMRWHAVPPRPYRLFEAMWDVLRPVGLMHLLLAEQQQDGRPRLLAGSVFLRFQQTVFYAFNGCWRTAMPLRANDVIQWHAMCDAASKGYRRYDLGEVAETQEGLHEFKSKWGAQARRLVRYYSPAIGRATVREADDDAGERHLTASVWHWLPSTITATIGDQLYRYL